MAKMIPSYINPDVKSNAERKIFALLSNPDELTEFTCLHSLGLSRHLQKRQGEIDFVLVGKGLIFCLEVKGGRVSRKDGIWVFEDRYGQENKKVEGPFEQASSGMYSLKSDLESKLGQNHGYIFGYGVLFPDIEFKEVSPEWDKEIVYDVRDLSNPISKYIERLSDYWTRRTHTALEQTPIPKSRIVDYLRGDFESGTRLWSDIVRVEDQIISFTKEQYRALDQMEGNPRTLFTGVAGTGKTLLAVEKARRLFYSKQKTLLLCFNRLLGVCLRNEVATIDPESSYLHANSIHKFFLGVIQKAGLQKELDSKSKGESSDKVYNEILPSVFLSAAEKTIQEKFDWLIIDEAQDLLSENYLIALDSVLKRGLKEGNWVIFLDPGGQAKLFNRFSSESYAFLKNLGAPEYRLDLNVRNTLQIATQASIVSGFPAGKPRVEGPKVEFILCTGDEEMALKVVELINKLVSEEAVPPSSITLLTSRNIGSMSLYTSGVRVPRFVIEANEDNISSPPKDKVLYASAQTFKGLENNIIVYIDVDSFSGRFSESANYVAMTRAKDKLYIFMDKKLKGEYQQRLADFVK